MEMNNVAGFEMENVNNNDFGLIDFMEETNFEEFFELIRSENAEPAAKFCPNYDCEHISGCLEESQINNVTAIIDHEDDQLFDFNMIINNAEFDTLDLLHGDDPTIKVSGNNLEENQDEEEEEEESSGTTTTTNTTNDNTPMKRTSRKTDRSTTLISERKRRGRMKEKLYALRSLVPNITKMDKASIIGDAVLYLQDLQMHAKKLKSEIVSLETSLTHPNDFHERSFQSAKSLKAIQHPPIIKKILQMEVFQMEEGEFYGRIVCNKGQGIAALLYKALESLTNFKVQSSNLAAPTQNYVLTFTLHVEELKVQILDLPNLKLRISSVLINLGFDFVKLPQV